MDLLTDMITQTTRDATASPYVNVYLSRRAARALIAAANRVLTDDPNAHGNIDARDLSRATDELGTAMGGGE